MDEKRKELVIKILALAVLILTGIIVYGFSVKPAFDRYVFEKNVEAYKQGVSDTANYLINEINQKGYAEISIENQTTILVPYQNPSQQKEPNEVVT